MATKRTLPERIEYVMEQMGWRPVELAKAAGCSRQYIWNVLNDRSQSLDPELAFNLQDRYRWNARWLLCDEGPERIEVLDADQERFIEALRGLPPERRKALETALGL